MEKYLHYYRFPTGITRKVAKIFLIPFSSSYIRILLLNKIFKNEFIIRYLHKKNWFKDGLEHNIRIQKALIYEALMLGRIPVIAPFCISGMHNFGKHKCVSIDDFYDLENSFYRYKNLKGETMKKPIPYIKINEFMNIISNRKNRKILSFSDGKISDKDNKKYPIIMYNFSYFFQNERHFQLQKEIAESGYEIFFQPAKSIQEIGEKILKKLPSDFWTIHYRKNDDKDDLSRYNSQYNELLNLKNLEKKLLEIFPEKATIYILHNVWDDLNFFAPLNQYFKIKTFNDFPELKKYINDKNPDTAFLFAIERFIQRKSLGHFEINQVPMHLRGAEVNHYFDTVLRL